jgi:glycine/D-amino acid oxidase-like deaminating enzyme/nitrite reductase/ring-hydroxylating ferredoxin subunit
MNQNSISLWNATAPKPTFQPLTGSLECDVAIVGGGITGLTAALLLAERNRSVVVIEREGIGGGETGNTTAHITTALDAGYHYIRRKYGKDEAKLAADASRRALETIASFVDRLGIACHFKRVGAWAYTEKRKYVAELKNEAAAAREAGLQAEWTAQVPLPFDTRGAIFWPDQAQFHPAEYLAGLAARAAAVGVRIFERSLVTEIADGEPCIVRTADGAEVRARSVVQATNTPVAGFTTVHTKGAAYRTYAVAWQVPSGHPEGLFWDTADPYHYSRTQETDEGTFLIIGGEDHRVGENDDTEGCFERLTSYARQYFGSHPEKYRWSGQIIEPHGGLPLIGGSGNIYISTGYSGQGMTMGTAGAILVADLISGIENPWRELFDPSRLRPDVTSREFITENLHFPRHLIADRLTSSDVEGTSLDDVPTGEARILSIDGKKVAAWRDDSGAIHAVSAVCTHMKCDVAWNDAERTWDCPCHGSRFTPDGDVLNGPASTPLEKLG